MESQELIGKARSTMYIREVIDLKVITIEKLFPNWKWLWYKVLGKSIPNVYNWLLRCKIEDGDFLVKNDLVSIHGITYFVKIYGEQKLLETFNFQEAPPSINQFKDAQVLLMVSAYCEE